MTKMATIPSPPLYGKQKYTQSISEDLKVNRVNNLIIPVVQTVKDEFWLDHTVRYSLYLEEILTEFEFLTE